MVKCRWNHLSCDFKKVEVTTCSSCHQEWVCEVSVRFLSTNTVNHVVESFFVKQPHDFIRYENSFRNFLHQNFVDNHYFHLNVDLNFHDFYRIFDKNFDNFVDQCFDRFCLSTNQNWHEVVSRCYALHFICWCHLSFHFHLVKHDDVLFS